MLTRPVGVLISLIVIPGTLETLHYRQYCKALLLNLMAAMRYSCRNEG